MKRQVMEPFRAPRRGGKAMIRQVIKESQAIDENPVKAKGVVKALSGKASSPRRSPRKTGKQDTVVHSIPCKNCIKMMSEREVDECTQHGEVLRWSTDSGEDEEYPQPTLHSNQAEVLDSEGPTQLEVVSPCLSEFESPGFLSRRKALSRQAQAKRGKFDRAKQLPGTSSVLNVDVVPVMKVVKRKAPASFKPLQKNVAEKEGSFI
jgi:hypothetical protein